MRTTYLLLALLLASCGTSPISPGDDASVDASAGDAAAKKCATSNDCPHSSDCCDGACLDVTADAKNCGACGKACPSGAHSTPACQSSVCSISCDPNFGDCDKDPKNGCESDTSSDGLNCGMCGKACGAIANGTPSCKSGTCTSTCNVGFADCDNSQQNGCETNINSDQANCGSCGMACGALANAQTTCSNGACAILGCNQGFADCDNKPLDGCEADLTSDPATCGGCGKVCPNYPNATRVCMSGSCSIGPCNAGFADCDNLPQNGCETPVANDLANCGGCGKVCSTPHGTPVCMAGACTIAACDAGYSDCDKMPQTGCEVQIAADPANCGKCGMACPVPANAAASCTNGACSAACKFGFGDCDKNLGNGCEAPLASDLNNCGQCGMVCPGYPNSTPGCSAGMCGIGMCQGLFGNCDGNVQNGCEKSLAADVNNCGACGKVCSFQNGQGGCLNGMCGLQSCNNGFADCNNNGADGCEININTDVNNCSMCGKVCPNGQTCAAGVCQAFACNPVCANGGQCIANNMCQTPPRQPGNYGPVHTFAGLQSSWYISTGQGSCSVGNMQNAAIDAQYFCQHFYGPNCNVQNGWMQGTTAGPNQMHKNSGCTSSGNDIPNTVCDTPNAPGMPCKIWTTSAGYGGITNLICVCQ